MLMQTIRERTPELAVLKTLGFSNGALFVLVVVEATLVCVAAAFVGLALALGAFPFAAKFVPGLSMPLSVVILAAALTGFNERLEMAAISLGASRLRAFWFVTLPGIFPGVLSAMVFSLKVTARVSGL